MLYGLETVIYGTAPTFWAVNLHHDRYPGIHFTIAIRGSTDLLQTVLCIIVSAAITAEHLAAVAVSGVPNDGGKTR